MNEREYEEFIEIYFKRASRKEEYVKAIEEWSKICGIPILALTEIGDFFWQNFHLFSREESEKRKWDMEEEDVDEDWEFYFHDNYVEKANERRDLIGEREIDTEVKEKMIYYLYRSRFENEAKNKFNELVQDHHKYFETRFDRICHKFLEEYTLPLHQIEYLDQIVKAIPILPKKIVELMKAHALYFSSARNLKENFLFPHLFFKLDGCSCTITTCSSQFTCSYFGLMNGIFIENRENKDFLVKTFLHETGNFSFVSFSISQNRKKRSFDRQFRHLQFF